MDTGYDLIILGGGAAGLSAAIYAGRAMLKTLVLDGLSCGGQILVTDVIENYPGFPDGVSGPELSRLLCEHSSKYGAEMRHEQVTEVRDLEKPSKTVVTEDGSFSTKGLIIAAGGSHRRLGVPGEEELAGRGVSYCAVCDGNFFRGEDVVVVGGGDAALDEGSYLAGIVNRVTVVHRRDELRASRVLQQRALENPKFKFLWSHVVEEIKGGGVMEAVRVRDLKTGDVYDYPASAAFIYIGFTSNSDFLQGQVPVDGTGHIYVDANMRTAIPGVYAAGDIRVDSYRQLGTAVGDGISAALSAYRDLSRA